MRHYISIIAAALFALTSCQEFQPVFIGKYSEPGMYKYYSDADFSNIITIKQLAACYSPSEGKFVMPGNKNILQNAVIKGRVSTTDQPGNFYKSFYIQDETGGMEIKIGRNGLYNDYLPGQVVYVKLTDLTLGMYGYKTPTSSYGGMGMVQVGFVDPSGEYETSYLENALLVDTHVLRGDPKDIQIVQPVVTAESGLPNGLSDTQASNKTVGSLVTLENLIYAKEIFCLMYVDNNANHKLSSNRIFLSDRQWGVTTLAMSESKMEQYLLSGIWDTAEVGSGKDMYGKLGDEKYKGADGKYSAISRSAYTVNQYFKMGSTSVEIRTSGYSKFADKEIPTDVLNGSRGITVTGVLSLYQGGIQLTVNSAADFKYSDTGELLYK